VLKKALLAQLNLGEPLREKKVAVSFGFRA
jgi:hypothetical protein